jgi:L-ascorbate metabolism protein UlaG (beta-lactamase superfamily)
LPPLPDKPLFVFVSHRHHDHYSPAIWDLAHGRDEVYYILDKDVTQREGDNILRVAPHQRYSFRGLKIETLLSTDEGCAFLIEAEGLLLYHAGDLNWWHWAGEAESFNRWQEKTFKQEIARLRGRRIDCAFAPLDPRLEDSAWWGFAELLGSCEIAAVFPMHYGERRAEMLRYLERPELQPYRHKIITDITKTL